MAKAPVGETEGFAYFNEDAGLEWSLQHPIESGEVPDATEIEPMTLNEFNRRWPYDPNPPNEEANP
jgi:hypothetical protein